MKLTEKDKKLLRDRGYRDKDFWQIEEATRKTIYTRENGTRISAKTALELLGRSEYLSGICRSAFHFTAARETSNGGRVHFDSSALFREA